MPLRSRVGGGAIGQSLPRHSHTANATRAPNSLSPRFLAALVLLPAGRIDWAAGRIFIAVLVAAFGLSALLLARANPMIYRARSRFQPGTEKWDLILLAILFPAIVIEIPFATRGNVGLHDD